MGNHDLTADDLVILVPVLDRPHRVAPTIASAKVATPEARVLFIADSDDDAELAALAAADAEVLLVEPGTNYARKINLGFDATTEPLLFTGADDLDFVPGWFENASPYIVEGFGVVGTYDQCNPRTAVGEHSTHSLIARSYIDLHSGVVDEHGKVFHEGYHHEYCDDELVETAKARGAFVSVHSAVVVHLHPWRGRAPDDETYQKGRQGRRLSRSLFRERSQLWTTSLS